MERNDIGLPLFLKQIERPHLEAIVNFSTLSKAEAQGYRSLQIHLDESQIKTYVEFIHRSDYTPDEIEDAVLYSMWAAKSPMRLVIEQALEDLRYNEDQKIEFYSAFAEAYTNIFDHAEPTELDVMLTFQDDMFSVAFSHNGKQHFPTKEDYEKPGLDNGRRRGHILILKHADEVIHHPDGRTITMNFYKDGSTSHRPSESAQLQLARPDMAQH